MTAVGPAGYGLGIAKESGYRTDVYAHSGLILGYATYAAYAPELDRMIVVGATSDRPPQDVDEIVRDLQLAVLSD